MVREHFQNWTAKRSTQPIENHPEWEEEYYPKNNIRSSWYQDTTKSFTNQEIKNTIIKMESHSAPGQSEIHT
jgi:hypothetical protein